MRQAERDEIEEWKLQNACERRRVVRVGIAVWLFMVFGFIGLILFIIVAM